MRTCQNSGYVENHLRRSVGVLTRLQTHKLLDTTLEALKASMKLPSLTLKLLTMFFKTQRDLFIAMRDLFIRHDRLSFDQVDRLKKRVETNSLKLEGIKAVQKEGWQDEADRIVGTIEKDQATIVSQLNRRVFIRSWYVDRKDHFSLYLTHSTSMWHEIRVVLHNRENTLLTLAVQIFAREEQEYAENVANNWASLVEAVEGMPLE